MTATTSGVPDLLQRFVPTPFATAMIVNGVEVTLHGNVNFGALSRQPATTDSFLDTLTATVICDPEAPDAGSELTFVKSWPVTTVLIGTGTILALDCERAEILGFLAPSISPTRFITDLLPMLVDLHREMKLTPRTEDHQQL